VLFRGYGYPVREIKRTGQNIVRQVRIIGEGFNQDKLKPTLRKEGSYGIN
jgi:hypothetical protein